MPPASSLQECSPLWQKQTLYKISYVGLKGLHDFCFLGRSDWPKWDLKKKIKKLTQFVRGTQSKKEKTKISFHICKWDTLYTFSAQLHLFESNSFPVQLSI